MSENISRTYGTYLPMLSMLCKELKITEPILTLELQLKIVKMIN